MIYPKIKADCPDKQSALYLQRVAKERGINAVVIDDHGVFSLRLDNVGDSDLLYMRKAFEFVHATDVFVSSVGSGERMAYMAVDTLFNHVVIPIAKDIVHGAFVGIKLLRNGAKEIKKYDERGDYAPLIEKLNRLKRKV